MSSTVEGSMSNYVQQVETALLSAGFAKATVRNREVVQAGFVCRVWPGEMAVSYQYPNGTTPAEGMLQGYERVLRRLGNSVGVEVHTSRPCTILPDHAHLYFLSALSG